MNTMRMEYTYTPPERKLQWAFPDGQSVAYVHSQIFNSDGTEIVDGSRDHSAYVNGWKQKIADAAAIVRNPDTGAPATFADKRAAMQRVIDTLNAGDWNAERAGGAGGGLLAIAIANVKKADVKKIAEYLKTLSGPQRDAIAVDKRYAGELARLRKARVAEVDVADAMKALDAME